MKQPKAPSSSRVAHALLPKLPPHPGDQLVVRGDGRSDRVPYGHVDTALMEKELGIDRSQVRYLVRSGFLRPVAKTANNYPVYSREEVLDVMAKVPKRKPFKSEPRKRAPERDLSDYTSEQASVFFRRILAGEDPAAVQFDLNLHPRAIARMRREQAEAVGQIVIGAECLRAINNAGFDGEGVTNEDELLALLARIRRERVCVKCQKREAVRVCASCAREVMRVEQTKKPATS